MHIIEQKLAKAKKGGIIINLNDLQVNEDAIVESLNIDGLMRERLLALGLTKRTKVTKIRKGSKNEIAVYLIRDVMIALREEEAKLILVS